jgi:hypothetical protein
MRWGYQEVAEVAGVRGSGCCLLDDPYLLVSLVDEAVDLLIGGINLRLEGDFSWSVTLAVLLMLP